MRWLKWFGKKKPAYDESLFEIDAPVIGDLKEDQGYMLTAYVDIDIMYNHKERTRKRGRNKTVVLDCMKENIYAYATWKICAAYYFSKGFDRSVDSGTDELIQCRFIKYVKDMDVIEEFEANHTRVEHGYKLW